MTINADLPDGLGAVLLALGGRITRLETEILASLEQPLTLRQYRILSRVDAGHTSLTALCKLARRGPSTMSESVDKLVNQRFLIRGTSDTSRRTMRLELTAKGRNALEAADSALKTFTGELTADIPRDLEERLVPALTRIYLVTNAALDDR